MALSTSVSIVIYLYTSAVFYQYFIGHTEFPSSAIRENESFDYIVIGGGTAGSLVAARLSEDPSNIVLLIDRGGSGNDYSDIPFYSNGIIGKPAGYHERALFKYYKTTPQKYVCAGSRGKCAIVQGNALGGGGNAISNYVRGSPLDFDEWEAMGARRWSYADVLPYFKATERCINETLLSDGYHGSSGQQFVSNTIGFPRIARALRDAAKENGYITDSDYNDARFTNSFDYAQDYVSNGVVYTSRRAFLEPALGRKNLKVICFSEVTRILFERKKAIGVQIHSNGKDSNIRVSKEVIVSAGAIETPKLLMLSGLGDAQELKKLNIPVIKNLPAVGKNLQDQIFLDLKFVPFPNSNQKYVGYDIEYSNVEKYWKSKSGLLAKNPTLYIGFLNIAPFSKSANDTRMEFIAVIQPPGFGPSLALSITNLNVASKGYVKLASADPKDDPIINPNYLVEEEDRKIFRSGVKKLVAIAKSKAIQKLGLKFVPSYRACSEHITLDSFLDDAFIDCFLRNDNEPSLYQFTSSCRMGNGKDIENTVVDPNLKVIGIENLRIIDSSIMPHITRGNPNAAVTMIAEKGAAMIMNV